MSRFFSERYKNLVPYVPGEQPKDKKYVKLNTNESPFGVSEKAKEEALKALEDLRLYPDPDSSLLCARIAEAYDVLPENVFVSNGSDEALNFAFMAFCSESCPAVFPDITYGFYPVFSDINSLPYQIIPLREDFSIPTEEFIKAKGTLIIANPNAPTGLLLGTDAIERMVRSDLNRVVIVDEAYIDFGGKSSVGLTKKYDNLLVVQTFSKSRSMAGARLGFAIGNRELIRDLNTLKYSTNPYNVDRLAQALGIGALKDEEYFRKNCAAIIENREYLTQRLLGMGFNVIPSMANFVFARNPRIPGKDLYLGLKEKGVLVRYFDRDRLKDYVRISIGTKDQLDILLDRISEILS